MRFEEVDTLFMHHIKEIAEKSVLISDSMISGLSNTFNAPNLLTPSAVQSSNEWLTQESLKLKGQKKNHVQSRANPY